jgi:hypothetical protein
MGEVFILVDEYRCGSASAVRKSRFSGKAIAKIVLFLDC